MSSAIKRGASLIIYRNASLIQEVNAKSRENGYGWGLTRKYGLGYELRRCIWLRLWKGWALILLPRWSYWWGILKMEIEEIDWSETAGLVNFDERLKG